MGTHPIFESDFDCLTETKKMSLRKLWPRRALFYTPGSDLRKMAKIGKLKGAAAPDFVAVDIEDGVAMSAKGLARKNIIDTYDQLLESRDAKTQIGIRVNSVSSGLLAEDMRIFAEMKTTPEALLLPKVESALEVEEFLELSSKSISTPDPIPLVVFIESAIGLLNMRESLEAFKNQTIYSLESIVFGSDDYVASIGAKRSINGGELAYARQSIVAHACAYGLQSIDMVYINFRDLDGLEVNAQQGADLGFTGKQVTHPGNIETVQRVFSPSREKIEWARELISEFNEHAASGKGAFTFRGQMIDMPLVKQANNILQYS